MSAVFACCQRSLPAVHHCFWCQAAAVWPRVPLLVAIILICPNYQAARTRSSLLASLWVPRFGSLGYSGRKLWHSDPDVETDQPRVASFKVLISFSG